MSHSQPKPCSREFLRPQLKSLSRPSMPPHMPSTRGARLVYLPANVSSLSGPGACPACKQSWFDRLQHLLRRNADAIAGCIVLEQGKTLAGTFISWLCRSSITDMIVQTLMATYSVVCRSQSPLLRPQPHSSLTNLKVRMLYSWTCADTRINSVSKDMDTYVRKLPLGVCASIAPFNFPAYVWLALALACYPRTLQYDSSLDNSHGRSHRQYPHLQAFWAWPWRRNDHCRTLPASRWEVWHRWLQDFAKPMNRFTWWRSQHCTRSGTHCKRYLRPPCYPSYQLRRWWPCWEAHLQSVESALCVYLFPRLISAAVERKMASEYK